MHHIRSSLQSIAIQDEHGQDSTPNLKSPLFPAKFSNTTGSSFQTPNANITSSISFQKPNENITSSSNFQTPNETISSSSNFQAPNENIASSSNSQTPNGNVTSSSSFQTSNANTVSSPCETKIHLCTTPDTASQNEFPIQRDWPSPMEESDSSKKQAAFSTVMQSRHNERALKLKKLKQMLNAVNDQL